MHKALNFLVCGAVAALSTSLVACERNPPEAARASANSPDGRAVLTAHSKEFERGLRRVNEQVYQAVGFGLANSMLVVGEPCAFVIDAMGSVEAAGEVQAAFDAVTDKPIKALIYTHNHADHVFGGAGLHTDVDLAVFAHETTEQHIDSVVNMLRPVIATRSARTFGSDLPRRGEDAVINAGIGPFLEISANSGTVGLVRPTVTFEDTLTTTLCGIDVVLQHAPGESDDQIYVWLPQLKTLFPGDNIYKAFPNLYAVRGTRNRDVLKWIASLDAMRALNAEYLVPSHTGFLAGEEEIADTLTAYRDAIQFVHDQTVRGMNEGLTPDDIVGTVQLPPHLAQHPYLQEVYGTVDWSVRGIFNGYLGWFSGDAAQLDPASRSERAAAMVDLAGSRAALLDAAREQFGDGQYSLAAEFAGHLLALDDKHREARQLRHDAFRALAERSTSANGRHYYLTSALESLGALTVEGAPTIDERVRALIYSIPIENFLAAMPTRLNPSASADKNITAAFYFRDTEQYFGMHVRRGVAQFQRGRPDMADLTVTTSTDVWRRIVLGERNLAVALARGELDVEGGAPALVEFLRLFR